MQFGKKTYYDKNGNPYSDITTRLFAIAVDLVILMLPNLILTNIILGMLFAVPNQYDVTVAHVFERHPELQVDAIKLMRYIAQYYPGEFVIIVRQFMIKVIISIFLLAIYIIPFIHKLGSTPGKMLVGLKVVDSITGQKISWTQSIIRFFGYFISFPLGLIFAGMRKDRRSWHDFISDSVVIFSTDSWYRRFIKAGLIKAKQFFNIKH